MAYNESFNSIADIIGDLHHQSLNDNSAFKSADLLYRPENYEPAKSYSGTPLPQVGGVENNLHSFGNSLRSVLKPIEFQKDKGIKTVDYSVRHDDVYTKLGNGTYIPKFKGYIDGVNDEDRLARQQGTFEKAYTGLTRGAIKVGTNFLDATVGTAVGLVNGAIKGSYSAIWDNDFSNMMDDVNTKLDNKLALYKTNEAKSYNFLERMLYDKGNFFFGEVTDAASFIVGALLPEIAITALTGGAGGAGLGATLARMGAKSAYKAEAKSLFKAGLKEATEIGAKRSATYAGLEASGGAGKAIAQIGKVNDALFSQKGSDVLRGMWRAKLGKVGGDVMHTFGFLNRTAGYEAALEARHSFKESIDNYYNDYYEKHGEYPSAEDAENFFVDAKDAANAVYGANLVIVGTGSMLQFANDFGLPKINWAKTSIGKSANKLIGVGFETLEDGTLKAVQANRLQKIAGGMYTSLKRPFIESQEEGLQSVATNVSHNYLHQKYIDGNDEAFKLYDNVLSEYGKLYNTKEGWDNLGMGALMGIFGGVFSKSGRAEMKHNLTFQGRKALQAKYNANIKVANEGINNYGESLFKNLNRTSAVIAFGNNSRNNSLNLHTRSNEGKIADKEFIRSMNELMTNKQIKAQQEAIIDNTTLSDEHLEQLELAGISVEDYKQSLKNDFNQSMDEYNKAKDFVEMLGLEGRLSDLSDGNREEVIDGITTSIYLGRTALHSASNIAQQMERLLGVNNKFGGGIYNFQTFYNNLEERYQEQAQTIRDNNTRVSNIDLEIKKLSEQMGKDQAERTRRMKDSTVEGKINERAEKIVELNNERENLISQNTTIAETLKKRFNEHNAKIDGEAFVDNDSVLNLIKQLDEYKGFKKSIKGVDDRLYKTLDYLENQYSAFLQQHSDSNTFMDRMTATDFFKKSKEGQGLVKSLVGINYESDADFMKAIRRHEEEVRKQLGNVGIVTEGDVADWISNNIKENKNLSEREKFRLESLAKIVLTNIANNSFAEDKFIDLVNVESDILSANNQPILGDSIKTLINKATSLLQSENWNVKALGDAVNNILDEIDRIKKKNNTDERVKIDELNDLINSLEQKKKEVVDKEVKERKAKLDGKTEIDILNIESEKEDGDYQKLQDIVKDIVDGKERNSAEDLQLQNTYPKLFEEYIRIEKARQDELDKEGNINSSNKKELSEKRKELEKQKKVNAEETKKLIAESEIIVNKIEKLNAEIKKKQNSIDTNNKSLEKLKSELDKLNKAKEDNISKKTSKQEELAKVNEEIKDLEDKISKSDNSSETTVSGNSSEIEELEKALEDVKQKIEFLKIDKSPLIKEKQKLEQELKDAEEESKVLNKDSAKVIEAKEKIINLNAEIENINKNILHEPIVRNNKDKFVVKKGNTVLKTFATSEEAFEYKESLWKEYQEKNESELAKIPLIKIEIRNNKSIIYGELDSKDAEFQRIGKEKSRLKKEVYDLISKIEDENYENEVDIDLLYEKIELEDEIEIRKESKNTVSNKTNSQDNSKLNKLKSKQETLKAEIDTLNEFDNSADIKEKKAEIKNLEDANENSKKTKEELDKDLIKENIKSASNADALRKNKEAISKNEKAFEELKEKEELSFDEEIPQDILDAINERFDQELKDVTVPQKVIQSNNNATEVITDNVYSDFKKGVVSKKTLNSIATKLNDNQPLSEREAEIAKERFNQVSKILRKKINARKDGVFKELRNAKRELAKLSSRGVKVMDTNEYKRYAELIAKQEKSGLNQKEQKELDLLNTSIEEWNQIAGTISDGVRLSDLLRQYTVLKNTKVEDDGSFTEISPNDIEEMLSFEDSDVAVHYKNAQHYDAVFSVVTKSSKKGDNTSVVRISNITEQGFLDLLNGVSVDYYMTENGTIEIPLTEIDKINDNTNIRVRPNGADGASNYSTVVELVPNPDMSGTMIGVPLKSDFKNGLDKSPTNEDIYSSKVDERVVVTIDYSDPYNAGLIEDYADAVKSKDKDRIKQTEDNLKKNLVLVEAVIEPNGHRYIGIAKSDRGNENTVYSSEDAEYVALRRKIISEFIDVRIKPALKEKGAIMDNVKKQGVFINPFGKIEKIYNGHPNFTYVDGGYQYSPINPNLANNIVDVGYVENGVPKYKNGDNTETIDTTYISRSIKEGWKTPFVVMDIGQGGTVKLIALPVRMRELGKADVQGLRDILNNNGLSSTEKSIRLNKELARLGVDIKSKDNAFMALGALTNVTNKEFNKIVSQIENKSYFRKTDNWFDDAVSVSDILGDIEVNFNLSNPMHSPKVRIDYSSETANLDLKGIKVSEKGKKAELNKKTPEGKATESLVQKVKNKCKNS